MRFKKITLLFLFLFICSFFTNTAHAQSTDTYWNMAGANPQRTSWLTSSFSTSGFGVIWSLPIEAFIDQKTQIVTSDSTSSDAVYIATTKGLYAIRASNGSVLWKFNTNLPVATPTVVNNVVYFGGYDKRVYALDASSGSAIWSTSLDSGVSTNPIVENGRVFIGSRSGYFYGINASNGNIDWQYPSPNSMPLGTIAQSAASDGTNIYFATNDMYAYALRETNGSLVWKSSKPLTGERLESWWPVVVGNYVIFTLSPEYRQLLNPGNSTISSSGEYTNGGELTPGDNGNGVEKRDVFGNDGSGYIGSRGNTSGGEWSSGNNFIDTETAGPGGMSIKDYFNTKPYRASFVSINRSNVVCPDLVMLK